MGTGTMLSRLSRMNSTCHVESVFPFGSTAFPRHPSDPPFQCSSIALLPKHSPRVYRHEEICEQRPGSFTILIAGWLAGPFRRTSAVFQNRRVHWHLVIFNHRLCTGLVYPHHLVDELSFTLLHHVPQQLYPDPHGCVLTACSIPLRLIMHRQ